MGVGNGTPVTWRELNLLITPLQDDVTEMKADVKSLLATQAGDEALSNWQRWFFGAVFLGILSAVISVLWLTVG